MQLFSWNRAYTLAFMLKEQNKKRIRKESASFFWLWKLNYRFKKIYKFDIKMYVYVFIWYCLICLLHLGKRLWVSGLFLRCYWVMYLLQQKCKRHRNVSIQYIRQKRIFGVYVNFFSERKGVLWLIDQYFEITRESFVWYLTYQSNVFYFNNQSDWK